MRFWRKLHNIIDKAWRHTHASIMYYFDSRKKEVDIDKNSKSQRRFSLSLLILAILSQNDRIKKDQDFLTK